MILALLLLLVIPVFWWWFAVRLLRKYLRTKRVSDMCIFGIALTAAINITAQVFFGAEMPILVYTTLNVVLAGIAIVAAIREGWSERK